MWEQSLTSDLAEAGVKYTMLDDFHFKNAGLNEDELHGYYITEDDGQLLSVFPGSERLRYTIPFREPQETIDYLRPIAEQQPGAVVVFGDDGEKFGVWPGTKEHVYDHGWLRRFLDALVENRSWLSVVTPTEALDQVPPIGKVYIPEGSYREMTEWALPTERLKEFIQRKHDWEHESRWHEVAPFVRGGYWRNFKVKYPETNEMYARMQMVSRRLHELTARQRQTKVNARMAMAHESDRSLQRPVTHRSGPRRALPRPMQLRLLARRVRRRISAAPPQCRFPALNLRRKPARRRRPSRPRRRRRAWVELTTDDYNFDARPEVRLASNRLVALVRAVARRPSVRARRPRHLSQLARHAHPPRRSLSRLGPRRRIGRIRRCGQHPRPRRFQAERPRPTAAIRSPIGERASSIISTRSMYRPHAVAAGQYEELGDFVNGAVRSQTAAKSQPHASCSSRARADFGDRPIQITKGLTLEAGGQDLKIAYLHRRSAARRDWSTSASSSISPVCPAAATTATSTTHTEIRSANSALVLISKTSTTSASPTNGLASTSNCTPISRCTFGRSRSKPSANPKAASSWCINRSSSHPHWYIRAGNDGRWVATMNLAIDTSMAEKRPSYAEAAATV